MSSGQVRARFVTNHDDYRISDAPFAIPAKLGRRGLSEVINHLLGNESEGTQKPFDFSIQDILVRSPLSVFLAQQQMSAEAVIEIEYMPAMALSDEKDTIDTPAWVGCMHYHEHESSKSLVAGCYDGGIEIINVETRATAAKHQCHADPIRDIFRWSVNGNSTSASTSISSILATGSKDQTVRLWAMGADAQAKDTGKKGKGKREAASSSGNSGSALTALAVCKGHIQSVESLTLLESNGTKVLLSGDWAGNIMGWNVQRAGDDDFQGSSAGGMDVEEEEDSSNKKRKTSKGSSASGKGAASTSPVKTLSSIFTFKAHSQSISAMHTLAGTATTFTCSWDHSIKQWDMERQDVVSVFTCGSKISTSLHANAKSGLVATSHSDGKVRLWDTRAGNSADSSASTCQSITNSTRAGVPQWVSDVQWHPTQTTAFACTDYGGVVRVWDIRSTKVPLSERETHDGKALCAQWADAAVFTGGSDCAVHATNFH